MAPLSEFNLRYNTTRSPGALVPIEETTRPVPSFTARLAAHKLRYQRGQAYIGLIQQAVALLILVKVWGIPPILVVPAFLAFLASTYLAGWMDERIGLWRAEVSYANINLNPAWTILMEKLDRIEQSGHGK